MKFRVWGSRAATGLAALFLFVDAFGKVAKIPQVVEGSARLGYPEPILPALGLVLAACTLIYVIPRTAALGAILLTGYLGGAVAAHLRAGDPAFPIFFPVMVATMVWGGLWTRDAQLRSLIPLRK